MLKNYSLLSLLWVVPAALVLGVLRLVYLVLGRRFEEAFDVVAAWGWNVAHLPSTLSLRRHAQKARRVRDRALRRFMESAGFRSPRWFATAERILEEQRAIDEADEGEPIQRRLRDRTASLVGSHPVIVGSFLAFVVGAVAVRELLGTEVLVGGALPAFPARFGELFAELASAFRSTPIGGQLAPSPAVGALGALSFATLGDPQLAQKAILIAGPPLAAILMYRATIRMSVRPGPAVVAAACYAVGALTFWAFSEGRLGLLVALAVLPAAAERIDTAFAREEPPGGRPRFVAGAAVTFAVGAAAYPGIVLAIAVLVTISVFSGPLRGRGVLLVGAGAVGAAVLLFPFVPTLFADGGRALSSLVGTTEPLRLARLALGPGPGTWPVAAFLPIGAVLGLGLVRGELRGPAARAAVAGGAGLILSWLAAANYLPLGLANPPAYAALAAVSMASLIGFGLTSFTGSLRFESFGLRQVGGGISRSSWARDSSCSRWPPWRERGASACRRSGSPPAWAVVSGAARADRSASCGSPEIAATGSRPRRVTPSGASRPATRRSATRSPTGRARRVLDTGRPLVRPRSGASRARAGRDPRSDHPARRCAALSVRDPLRGRGARGPVSRLPRRGARCTAGRRPPARDRLHDLPERFGDPARCGPRRPRLPTERSWARRPLHDRDVEARSRRAARTGVPEAGTARRRGDRLPVQRIRRSVGAFGRLRRAGGCLRLGDELRGYGGARSGPARGRSFRLGSRSSSSTVLWLAALWATRKPVAR